jgi:hypothetical protein
LGREVTHNVAVTQLTAGTLYFFNSGGIVVHNFTVDPTQTTFVVNNVPSAATSVGMIANPASDITSAAPTTFTDFKAVSFRIDNQTSMAGATGGTETAPDAVQGIALLDLSGKNTGSAANALIAVSGQDYTHTAAITLVPAVARIEIKEEAIIVKSGTNPNDTDLVSFDFEGIYINNYSPTFTLGFSQAATLFGSGIQGGGNADWSGAYKALNPSRYLYDENSANITTTAGVGSFAYHVFPGTVPHIIIKAKNFTYSDNDVAADPQYWLIDKYYEGSVGGEEITAFEPGYVYRISGIQVGDSFPPDDPYDEPAKVQVTVTVQKWQVQDTYVEPK